MNLRRWLLLLTIISLCLQTIGCTARQRNSDQYSGYRSNDSYNNYNYDYNFNFNYYGKNSPAVKYTKTHVIGLAMADTTLPYYASLVQFARNEAIKNGLEILVTDAGWNAQQQIEQISSFIKQKVDIIILIPVDPKLLADSTKEIKAANIPLINLNNKLDDMVIDLVDSYVGVSGIEQGELAAELMLEALKGAGGNIAIIQEEHSLNAQLNKTQGFINRLSQVNNTKVIAVESSPSNENQVAVATRKLLNENADIDGIFIYDDTMVNACFKAIEAAGRKGRIKLVGIGGSKVGYKAIKEGMLYGTVAQTPDWEGTQVIKCAIDILQEKKVKVWYRDPLINVTDENVEKYKGLW